MDSHSTLIHSGAAFICSTFVATAEEAERYAREYVATIDAHGGDVKRFSTASFKDLLTKELADRLQWRDPAQRVAWERERREQYESMKAATGIGRGSPFGKR